MHYIALCYILHIIMHHTTCTSKLYFPQFCSCVWSKRLPASVAFAVWLVPSQCIFHFIDQSDALAFSKLTEIARLSFALIKFSLDDKAERFLLGRRGWQRTRRLATRNSQLISVSASPFCFTVWTSPSQSHLCFTFSAPSLLHRLNAVSASPS